MVDLDSFIRTVAREYGFEEADLRAVQEMLGFGEDSVVVRVEEIASFADTFGIGVRALGTLISETTTGIEPWESDDDISPADWKRITGAIGERAIPGDWAHTILSLLDERDDRQGADEPLT